MRSFTLEAIRILNIWSEYILGKLARPKVDTPETIFKYEQKTPQIIPLFLSGGKTYPKVNSPKIPVWQKLKSAKLIRLPSYKGDADEQLGIGTLGYNSENYQLALLWYWLAARQGHAEAQFLLGLLYEEGEIIGQDYAKAVRYFKRSAEQGFVLGQNNYAWMLIRGDGVERNFEAGFKWYRLAAEQGFYKAQFVVGLAYFFGDWSSVAKQNFQEAVHWLRLSADQGDPDAQFYLGRIYHQGGVIERGQQNELPWRKISDKDRIAEKQLDLWLGDNTKDEVAQDFEETIKWYQLAADQDNPDAQFNLGLMHSKGHGVTQDHEKGMDLIESASEQDHPGALYHLGLAYDLGDGVEPDDDYSNCNYEIAAECGHSGARFGMTGDGSQNYRGN
jgi:uncharacterized protein